MVRNTIVAPSMRLIHATWSCTLSCAANASRATMLASSGSASRRGAGMPSPRRRPGTGAVLLLASSRRPAMTASTIATVYRASDTRATRPVPVPLL